MSHYQYASKCFNVHDNDAMDCWINDKMSDGWSFYSLTPFASKGQYPHELLVIMERWWVKS